MQSYFRLIQGAVSLEKELDGDYILNLEGIVCRIKSETVQDLVAIVNAISRPSIVPQIPPTRAKMSDTPVFSATERALELPAMDI